ncbi:MAG: primosomal protein N' [Dehalococcoidia bacterium]|nr:primosomal protein N' [Dehalococcoidia bacterium]
MPYADVAVDVAAPQATYTYQIPRHLLVHPGQAVWVPFGRASSLIQGLVFAVHDTTDLPTVKDIDSVIEAQPLLDERQRALALWLSTYYYAPLFEAAAVMMPPDFRQRVKTSVSLTHEPTSEDVPPGARSLLAFLEARGNRDGGETDLETLRRRFGATVDRSVEALVRRGLALKTSRLTRARAQAKFLRYVTATEAGRQSDLSEAFWARRPKQARVLAAICAAVEPVSAALLREQLGDVAAPLAALETSGYVVTEERRSVRDPLAGRAVQMAQPPVLTTGQSAAWQQLAPVLEHQESSGTFLVHGVTGSGKTELYLRALESVVAQGRRGIVLVPEIALEPQVASRFAARFPGRVAVLHSGLTAGELYDEWWRIRDGEFDVVVGSRSAIFAPQPELGLIVIDEEHESTYKQQDPAPRYDARRVARELARASDATVILGSATPGLESFVAALEHQIRLVELPDRVAVTGRTSEDQRGLASVEVVDLRQELKQGNRSIFSRSLQAGLARTLAQGQQAILFLNRRGSATFVQCRDCGYVLRCRRCDAPLTFHGDGDTLICHQCNARRRSPNRCPECSSSRIRYLGTGTQRVQQEVEALLPAARVMRWDRDVTRTRRTHEELLDRFAAHEADILVGTQMVAKGLDLPQVTLVGVVNADVNLYLPDFRAAERTFQLLTQVAGRAGRGEQAGNVIIQTYAPEHYAIECAAHQDYARFAHAEMAFRKRHSYPPFQPLIRLLYSDTDPEHAQRMAEDYARQLSQARAQHGLHDAAVLGPTPGFYRRARGRYRWQILLKGEGCRRLIDETPPPRGWVIDVDPLQVL